MVGCFKHRDSVGNCTNKRITAFISTHHTDRSVIGLADPSERGVYIVQADNGYIKLDRKMLEWEWYQNINTKTLFIHFLFKANWKDGRFEGMDIKRGSFVSSIGRLAVETSLTEREVRTAISHLKETGEVTSKSSNKFTVFTVVNYDFYQANDKQNDNQVTSERHSNDILTTTIEEKKESKKVRIKEIQKKSYSDNQNLNDAIYAFLDMRKSMKAPMTDRAIELLLSKLDKLADDDSKKIAILNQSIESGWKSVYALKDDSSKVKQYKAFAERDTSKTDLDNLEKMLLAKG